MFYSCLLPYYPACTNLARSLLDNKALNKADWSHLGSIFCLSGFEGLAQSGVDRKFDPLPVPEPIINAARESIEIEHKLQQHIRHINDQSALGYRMGDTLQSTGLKLISTSLLKGDITKLRLDERYRVNYYFIFSFSKKA